jgi:hypothetical protein
MENPSNREEWNNGKGAEFAGWRLPPSLFHVRSKFKDSVSEEIEGPGAHNFFVRLRFLS